MIHVLKTLYSEITLKYSQAQAHEDALCVKVYRLGEELSVAERAEQNQGIFIKAVILNKDLTEFNTMKDNLLAAEKNFATSQEEVLRLKSELEDAKSALLKEHEAKMKVTKKVIKRITVAEPVEKIEPAAPLQFSHQLNQ